MSTETGHSDLQALQERQRSSDSLTCWFCHWLGRISPCMSSHRRWARPRVEWSSSPVAMKLGHMVPASVLRQGTAPTQRGLAGFVVGAETEVFVGLVGVDELAGVHAVGGVEDALEGAEGFHQLFAEHLGEERAAALAVPGLSGAGRDGRE